MSRVALAVVLLLLAYPAAGLLGGMIPRNAGWRPPERGIEIFVESNGIHTGIVMPKRAAGVDWRGDFPARDLRDPRYAALDHVSVGWGERAFYLETPTWADVRVATVLRAALGSSLVMLHVDHLVRPTPAADVRRVTITPREYRRLAAYIRATRLPDGERQPGYYRYDAFYGARGRYSAIHTCNDWTGDALAFAGVRVGAWTPFPATLMWWF